MFYYIPEWIKWWYEKPSIQKETELLPDPTAD